MEYIVQEGSIGEGTSAKSTSGARTTTAARAGRLAERLRVKDDESPWSEAEIKEVRAILGGEIELHRQELELAEQELDDLLRASSDGAGDDQADAGAKTAERVHEIALAANSGRPRARPSMPSSSSRRARTASARTTTRSANFDSGPSSCDPLHDMPGEASRH